MYMYTVNVISSTAPYWQNESGGINCMKNQKFLFPYFMMIFVEDRHACEYDGE